MIEFTKSYKTSDGKLVASIPEAQVHELSILLGQVQVGDGETQRDVLAKFILEKKDVVVDILTTTSTSKPKARAIHGGTKKRTPKAVPAEFDVEKIGGTTSS